MTKYKFHDYTVGLIAQRPAPQPTGPTKVKIEIEFSECGEWVRLSSVNFETLRPIRGSAVLSKEEYEDQRPVERLEFAKWAMGVCGWSFEPV